MTDKQIIIDGIKTSKEDFIDNFSIELTNRNIFEREQIGDKYFEIILAKEQECETLASQLDFEVQKKECLEQECEELKENLSDLKKDLKFQNDKISELELDLQNANSTIENLDLMRVGEYNTLIDDYDNLKQTLTEIKEIAESAIKGEYTTKSFDYTQGMETIGSYVLQKISECEGNDE